MLSYKNWRQLNEHFGGTTFTLGVKSPNAIGVQGAVLGAEATEEIAAEEEKLEEAKKKKMFGGKPKLGGKPDIDLDDLDADGIDDEIDDEIGDDDMDACTCPKHGDVGDEGDEDDMGEYEDEEGRMLCKKCKKCKSNCNSKSNKKSKSKSNKKSKKNMTTEEEDWWDSIQTMMFSNTGTTNWDGLAEDALLSPEDPNAGLEGEPGPGEPGFAPQGRVGGIR